MLSAKNLTCINQMMIKVCFVVYENLCKENAQDDSIATG